MPGSAAAALPAQHGGVCGAPCSAAAAVLPAQQEGDLPAFCFFCFLVGEGDLDLPGLAEPPQQGFLLGLLLLLLLQAQPLPHLQPAPQPPLPLFPGPQQGFLLGLLLLLLLEAVVPFLLLQQLLPLGRVVGASGMPSWMKTTCCTSGLPTVRVPVLSKTTTCVLHNEQHIAPALMNMSAHSALMNMNTHSSQAGTTAL
jgi:hypothetical protein